MRHAKRKRTRYLMARMFSAVRWASNNSAQIHWTHKTAAEVLADVNRMMSDVRSIPIYPHAEMLSYLKPSGLEILDEINAFTPEDYARL